MTDAGPDAVPPSEALSYEQARDKLAAVVKRLEAGGLTLEQSLELWERGERLAAVCEEWLHGARARLLALSPASTLGRGYAIVQHRDDGVVRSAAEVDPGETLTVRFAADQLTVRADG